MNFSESTKKTSNNTSSAAALQTDLLPAPPTEHHKGQRHAPQN